MHLSEAEKYKSFGDFMKFTIIRNPSLKDFETVIPLFNKIFAAFPGHHDYNPGESYTRMLNFKHTGMFIVKDKEKLVGFGIFYERYSGFLHLWELGVDTPYRGQGIASGLYDHIENYAKMNGFKGVTMNTFNRYQDSLRLAIKRGYIIYDLEKAGDYKDDPKINLKLTFA